MELSLSARLVVAILNYRTADLAIDCLRSIAAEVPGVPGVRVYVADNDSQDGSAERIAAAIAQNGWTWAEALPLPRNGGFAYGNNAVVRKSREDGFEGDFVLLLNPDTRVRPGAIGSLLRFMQQHPEVGIAGSRLEDPDGTAQLSAFRFHTLVGEFNAQVRLGLIARALRRWVMNPPLSAEPLETDWVAGASMMVRKEVFRDIGLMDEGYFLYFEEVDFCLRAKRAGWSSWYVPESRVVHLVGQATGVTTPNATRRRLPGYWFDSRRRYFIKNHGPGYALAVDSVWFLGRLLWEVRRRIQRKEQVGPVSILSDYARNSVFVRGFRL